MKRLILCALLLLPAAGGLSCYHVYRYYQSRIESSLQEGRRSLTERRYLEARDHFQRVLGIDPRHTEARELLAEAERRIQEIYDPVYQRARTLARAGEMSNALRLLNQLEAEAPGFEQTPFLIAQYRRHPQVKQAIAAALVRARRQAAAGEEAEAYREVLGVLELDPDEDEARALRDQLAPRLEGQAEEQYTAGRQALAVGELATAAAHFQAVLALYPDHPGARAGREEVIRRRDFLEIFQRALAAEERDRLLDAYTAGQEAAAVIPNDHRVRDLNRRLRERAAPAKLALFQEGVERFRRRDLAAARDAFAALDGLFPADEILGAERERRRGELVRLAVTLYEEEQLRAALEAFTLLGEIYPGDEEVRRFYESTRRKLDALE